MSNGVSTNQLRVQALVDEVSKKTLEDANLQAQLYKLATENSKLKKQLKSKNKNAKGKSVK